MFFLNFVFSKFLNGMLCVIIFCMIDLEIKLENLINCKIMLFFLLKVNFFIKVLNWKLWDLLWRLIFKVKF